MKSKSVNRRDVIIATLATVGSFAVGVTVGSSRIATHRNDLTKNGGYHKGYVDGPFGQMHYYRQGGGLALVLLHQSPVSGRMFERAMPYLAASGLSAIALDTPGYGNSDIPSKPPSIEDYASALVPFLDGLGLASAHFLGHHTGASIAVNFAARHPERVDSLILNGPPLFSEEDLEELKLYQHAPHEIIVDGSHLLQRWQRRANLSKGWSDKDAMHRRVIDQLWAGPTSWYGHHAAFNYDMRQDFQSLSVPSMILTNTGDDIYNLAQQAKAQRPDMAYIELDGGTHDIVDEQPEAWSRAVANFVRMNSLNAANSSYGHGCIEQPPESRRG